jgi:hypothetical protein
MLALTRAGIDCTSLTAHQTFGQATPQNRLKQLPKRITITELPVAVIGCDDRYRFVQQFGQVETKALLNIQQSAISSTLSACRWCHRTSLTTAHPLSG